MSRKPGQPDRSRRSGSHFQVRPAALAGAVCRRFLSLVFEKRLEPPDAFLVPPWGIRYTQPGIDIMFGRIEVAVSHWRRRRDSHIDGQLQKRHNRIPAKCRRNIRTTRGFHPRGLPVKRLAFEERYGVAGILQVDDPQRSPFRSGNIKSIRLARKPY